MRGEDIIIMFSVVGLAFLVSAVNEKKNDIFFLYLTPSIKLVLLSLTTSPLAPYSLSYTYKFFFLIIQSAIKKPYLIFLVSQVQMYPQVDEVPVNFFRPL